MKTFCIVKNVLETQSLNLRLHCEEVEETLRENHPVFSKVESFMEDKVREARAKFSFDHIWDAHNNAIQVYKWLSSFYGSGSKPWSM
jgi:hypothetical protein